MDIRKDHPAVKKAIKFVRKEQEPDGSWFGRWGVNYIYGTALVLRGLEAIGMDLHEPCIQQGAEWLRMVQNAGRRMGRDCGLLRRSDCAGQGDSTPSQTAWAILGLLAADDTRSDSVARGIAYLMRTQRKDGSWMSSSTPVPGSRAFLPDVSPVPGILPASGPDDVRQGDGEERELIARRPGSTRDSRRRLETYHRAHA